MQIRELREYIERRGWTVAGEHVDVGISGTKDRRPELDKLMADALKRRLDAVIVWKFDRFARSVSHLLRALETFQALGIHFVSLSKSLDASTPAHPRGQGRNLREIAGKLGMSRSLVHKNPCESRVNSRCKRGRLAVPQSCPQENCFLKHNSVAAG